MSKEEEIRQQLDDERENVLKYSLFPGVGNVALDPCEILDFTKPFTPAPYILNINGARCLQLGSLNVVTGQAGHGKTMFLSMCSAAVLSGEYGNMRFALPGGEDSGSVLYIDTEQSEPDTIAFKNRVQTMNGWPLDDDKRAFHIVRLREEDDAKQRELKAFKAVIDYQPTLAIIDGVLDLTPDYNDLAEATSLVFRLMKLASAYNVCIIDVNHQNPLAIRNANEKMAGHLGSLHERKANDIFAVKRVKDPAGVFSYEVSDLKGRGRAPMENWSFVMQQRTPEIWVPAPVFAPTIAENGHGDRYTPEKISAWLKEYGGTLTWPATFRDVRALFAKAGVAEDGDQKECVDKAINRGFLLRQTPAEMPAKQKSARLYLNPAHFPASSLADEATPGTAPADPSLPFPPPIDRAPPF